MASYKIAYVKSFRPRQGVEQVSMLRDVIFKKIASHAGLGRKKARVEKLYCIPIKNNETPLLFCADCYSINARTKRKKLDDINSHIKSIRDEYGFDSLVFEVNEVLASFVGVVALANNKVKVQCCCYCLEARIFEGDSTSSSLFDCTRQILTYCSKPSRAELGILYLCMNYLYYLYPENFIRLIKIISPDFPLELI